MSRQSCDAFMDNLYEAYLAAGGSTGLDADGYTRLLKTLCADLPEHLVPYVFESLQVRPWLPCAVCSVQDSHVCLHMCAAAAIPHGSGRVRAVLERCAGVSALRRYAVPLAIARTVC